MAFLSNDTMLTLAGYLPAPNGYEIPNTNNGMLFDAACWNWVLSGSGLMPANDWKTPSSIVEELLDIAYDDSQQRTFPMAIKQTDRYPKCHADLSCMQKIFDKARISANNNQSFTPAQTEFASALLRVILRVNGICPTQSGPASLYSVVVKGSCWWSPDHWAIGVRFPPVNRLIYIQTYPRQAVVHNCNRVGNSNLIGMPEVTVGISGLRQEHVNVLDTVPKAPCRICGVNPKGRQERWYQCIRCGAIYCPIHPRSVLECNVCRNRTRPWIPRVKFPHHRNLSVIP